MLSEMTHNGNGTLIWNTHLGFTEQNAKTEQIH